MRNQIQAGHTEAHGALRIATAPRQSVEKDGPSPDQQAEKTRHQAERRRVTALESVSAPPKQRENAHRLLQPHQQMQHPN